MVKRVSKEMKGYGLLESILGAAIAALVVGLAVIPLLMSVNTSTWSSTNQTIFSATITFLILAVLVAVAYGLYARE